MNKKGIFLGLIADMLGWFIFFIGMLGWFIVFSLAFGNIKYDISAQGAYIDDKMVMINIMQTPVTNYTNVADEVLLAIYNNQEGKAKESIDTILNSIYGRADKVCWALWYYEGDSQREVMNEDCNGEKNILFDQTLSISSRLNELPLKIRLAVLGYRK